MTSATRRCTALALLALSACGVESAPADVGGTPASAPPAAPVAPAAPALEPTAFEPAVHSGDPSEAVPLCWSGRAHRLQITASGRGLLWRADSREPLPIDAVEVTPPASLIQLAVAELQDDLLVLAGLSTGPDAWSQLCRWRTRPLERAWCLQLPALQLSAAIVDEGELYAAGDGMISRIDARSGAQLWAHYDLRSANDAFYSFSLPSLYGDNVSFDASPPSERRGGELRIELERRSGGIRRIDPVREVSAARRPARQQGECPFPAPQL